LKANRNGQRITQIIREGFDVVLASRPDGGFWWGDGRRSSAFGQ